MDKEKVKPEDIPLLYLFVYKTMVEKFGKHNRIISRKKILEIWRRCIHNVPKKYHFYILQEMCDYQLLEKINAQDFELFGNDADGNLTLNEKFKLIESLTPQELKILEKMSPQKYKLLGAEANKKLRKLGDYFLW
jgi:hypothetical protein